MMPSTSRRRPGNTILIVDDAPENLAILHDVLDESGYTVLAAADGVAALASAASGEPDLILLDAGMPGMDGFATCRQLRAQAATRNTPVIFMTGPDDASHVAAAFDAGGTDYLAKPVRQSEMLARISTHLQAARQAARAEPAARGTANPAAGSAAEPARHAMDAFGHATLAVTPHNGRIVWQSPLARQWMQTYFALTGANGAPELRSMPLALAAWLAATAQARRQGHDYPPLTVTRGASRLLFTAIDTSGSEHWMVVLREESDAAQVQALIALFRLTQHEAEVLHWAMRGKSSEETGVLLGTDRDTITQHLRQLLVKLGVATQGEAAALAHSKLASAVMA